MRVGFILQEQKRARVLTPSLAAHAAACGVTLVLLDDASDTTGWESQRLDAIVHKLPEDDGLPARLLAFQLQHPALLLLDAPAAAQRLRDRSIMLQPLMGPPLVLKRPPPHPAATAAAAEPQQGSSSSSSSSSVDCCIFSAPPQVVLPAGCNLREVLAALQAAGMEATQQAPLLAKPLSTAARSGAGHELAAVFSPAGLEQLLQGALPGLQPPLVLQKFVPHGGALYKLYVVGPHVVLTTRSTLTLQQLHRAAAEAAAGDGSMPAGAVLLQRVSAEPLQPHASPANSSSTSDSGAAATCSCGRAIPSLTAAGGAGVAVALCDASVAGNPRAPPLWAVQQLAAYLRSELHLTLFNADIIAPDDAELCCLGAGGAAGGRCFIVVDLNYFPGFDKVPGAEELFARHLASLRDQWQQQQPCEVCKQR